MDKKSLSSSTSGYIIIAKLTEGAYPITIGSPKNEWPELKVTLNVKDVNTGYLLKSSVNQNWVLVNLQTSTSIAVEKQPLPEKDKVSNDDFAKILAEVVNDPSIAQVLTVTKNTQAIIVADANKKAEISEVIKPIKSEPIKSQSKGSQIAKLRNDSISGGFIITYLDRSNPENDTVKVFIPVTQSGISVTNENEVTVKTDPRFINTELPNPSLKADSGTLKKANVVITEKKVTSNSSLKECKKTATQNEFLKLRKQMTAEENEKNMIKTANKQFINTCFTTEQVKNLGLLFITEEEKYKFYVNAFSHISDAHNFGTLEDQLTNNYYKIRFKAMLSQ